MALKNLMVRLQSRAADTPDTPCFADTPAIVQAGQLGEAVNDPAQAVEPVATQAPVSTEPAEPLTDPNAWRERAAAYSLHHFKCPICKAAGRGSMYGLLCSTGAALWTSYQNT